MDEPPYDLDNLPGGIIMKKNAVMVMTARGPDRILREGGSQAWVLNPENARKYKYLVTVQNRHNGAWGGASEPHGTAFLIGRISDVVPSTDKDSDGRRYLVRISEYAEIKIPHKWRGSNPVRYISLDELGIDPAEIQFRPMPVETSQQEQVVEEPKPMPEVGEALKVQLLTIPQAKTGLAAAMGISPDQIEIIIKA
jgi:hypothetical protein